jgi:dTDP-4-amino-4,6-dideoxygalactose transaminase
MDWKVTLADLDFGEEEQAAVDEVLRSRWLTMGARTQAFETACAERLGCRHAVMVANGTAALELALRALGVGPGEDVLLPSLTFVAGANAVVAVGARPVFVDVESPAWPVISVDDARKKLATSVRAVMPMHYGGFPCRMPEIVALAGEAGIDVVEDAAHAPGATLEGRALGTWGAAGCLSLFSNKNVAVGEGGLVLTNADDLAAELRLLRSHGMTTLTWDRHRGHASEYDVVRAGHNMRPSEITAAIASVQLAKLPAMTERRRRVVERYRDVLGGVPGLEIPFLTPPAGLGTFEPAHHLFPVLLEPGRDRAAFREALRREGVQTSMHYPPIHLFTYYRDRFGLREGDLPATEEFAAREVTLPLHSRMRDAEVDLVTGAVKRALET